MEVSSVNLAENFLNVAIPFGNGTALASSADEEEKEKEEEEEEYYYYLTKEDTTDTTDTSDDDDYYYNSDYYDNNDDYYNDYYYSSYYDDDYSKYANAASSTYSDNNYSDGYYDGYYEGYYNNYYYNNYYDDYYNDDYYHGSYHHDDDEEVYVAPVNYQTNNGITVGLFGYENSYIDLSTGVYGTAQHIDATNSYSAFNILIGNAAPNCIMAGHGSTNLWGGSDFANDVLIGGASQDLFLYGKTEGSDSMFNASANDAVCLYDVSLSDIVAAGADGAGTVALIFNTGNGIVVSGSDLVSATFILRDGSKYAYNKVTHSWQTA